LGRYLATRLLLAVPTIIAITILIFLIMQVLPGDPLIAMFGFNGVRQLSPEDRALLMDQLHLSDPLWKQYALWMKDVFTLKLGESFFLGETVMSKILNHGPISAEIGILSIILAWIVGVPVGALSALKRNSLMDYAGRIFTGLFLAFPPFWTGLLLLLFLILAFDWRAPIEVIQLWDNPRENLEMVWGPALVLGLAQSAYVARVARSSFLDVMYEDYIRTARAKGLKEGLVLFKHVFPNAILPVITLSGILLGFALGGSVVVEVAFGVRGLGADLVQAITDRDQIVIQNLILLYGLIFIAINLLVDLAYARLDPRIGY
jgi:peptide/nickel transport system permease protein